MENDSQIDGYGEGEEPLVFHHKSGEYRKTEPKFAQDIANGKTAGKRGFFRVLVSTKGNRSIFIILCITFAIVFFVSTFGRNSYEAAVNNVSCNLKAFSFDDKVYITLELKQPDSQLKKRGKNKVATVAPQTVRADFNLYNTDKAVADKRSSSCVYDGSGQFIRETFENYDITQVKCTVTCGDKSAILTAKVEQR